MLDRESAVPLYLQIRNALRSEILEGPYQDGDPFYGEAELVQRFGVARGTVRQALEDLEREGHIRRERGRGTFIAKTGLAADKPAANYLTISFIVPHCRDSFVPTVLLGVEAAARERGAHILFRHVESNPALQSRALQEARAYGVAGVLLFPVDASSPDPALMQLLEEKFPVVLVDRYIKGLTVDYVITDGYGGMLRAVQHLLGLGHRRIGLVTWDADRAGQVGRLLGYRQALRDGGVDLSPELICQLREYPAEDYSPLVAFLSRPDRPTAIVALNDYLAVRVVRTCRELGLRIPEDLALIGFDDIDLAAQLEVPLTTVAQPIYQMGFQSARLLLDKIASPDQGIQRIILPTRLVIRESCGALASIKAHGRSFIQGANEKDEGRR